MSHLNHLSHSSGEINYKVNLPGSKSESNRVLIINKLSRSKDTIKNLSDSDDTKLLLKLLDKGGKTLDVKDAGTCMRFLTAYFCVSNRNKILTGSSRMCERPIGKLVDALRNIGFKLNYVRSEGFPPVEIIPVENKFLKNKITVDAGESSQYISALLMIAPLLPIGLILTLEGKVVSRPYVELTLNTMSRFGISYEWDKNVIHIKNQEYSRKEIEIESDWTAASYWFSIAALSKSAEIDLHGLKENSFQGDKIIAEWMKKFGVHSSFYTDGIKIKKAGEPVEKEMTFDFSNNPDLVQTILVLAAAKDVNLKVSGLKSLRIKETDRVAALQAELAKCNARLNQTGDDQFELISNYRKPIDRIETYNDHRMALAFAPLALMNEIIISNPLVVSKSYPGFWEHLKEAGFNS